VSYEEPTHAHPGGEPRFTPAQAIYDVLSITGYVKSKRSFARLLNVNEGNVYAYLTDPRPREGDVEDAMRGQNRARISARTDTLHGWCWVISENTGLALEIRLEPNRQFVLIVQGVDSEGRSIRPMRYRTIYHDYDFSEPVGWELPDTAKRLYVEHMLRAQSSQGRARKNHELTAARLAQRMESLGVDVPHVEVAEGA
jgi:hypothetical protein